MLAGACDLPGIETSEIAQSADLDENPVLAFTQVASSVGLARNTEPPSAGAFASSGTLAYGAWLADLDGDGRLDYYAVNHGQSPHRSGLWINTGTAFGRNLF